MVSAGGRQQAKTAPWLAAGGAVGGAPGSDVERGAGHLRGLYEISKLLTRFDGVEETLPPVVATVAQVFDLRSAIFILDTNGHTRDRVWQATGESVVRLDAARTHARTSYEYLVRSKVGFGAEVARIRALPPLARPDGGDPACFIVLPLLVDRRGIFGALQLEGASRLDELDLMFANAVTNQLAIALARHATIEARHATADEARSKAVRAEEWLRGKFDFVRDLTASLGEGVLAVDLEGRVTLVNRCSEELLGLVAEEARGRPVEEILQIRRSNQSIISAQEYPLAIAIRRGVVVRSDEQQFVTGSRPAFPVSYTAAPLRQDGRIQGAVLAFRDIIEVKRAELRQRFLAEVSGTVAASLDYQDTLVGVASASVPGFADLCFIDEVREDGTVERVQVVFADEAKQRRFAEDVRRFAPRPGRPTPQRRAIESRESVLFSEVSEVEDFAQDGPQAELLRAQDGPQAELLRAIGVTSLMAVPLCVRGQTFGVLTFATAESDRRYSAADLVLAEEIAHRTAIAIDNARLYAAAQRATRAREDLLAVVSHDLKSPLSVILMNVDVLNRLAGDGGPPRKHLASIERSAEQMNRLIQDLLDTASIEAGRLSVTPRPVLAGPIIAEAIEALEPLATTVSLVLSSEIPADLPSILADAARLHQVITNLVDNAIKFTREGGTIRVRGTVVGDEVQLSVIDTGAGIPAEEVPHIFDRFWQARRTAHLGTGLGLFIVKAIVEAHRGRIWVESQVGVGSTFFVTLPIAHQAGRADADAPIHGTGRPDAEGGPLPRRDQA